MKGIILAGGLGTRLQPLTRITNKHLLPIYDKPMIFYPVETLTQAGIDDIMLVTGGSFAGDFLQLLGNGREFGLKEIRYAYQHGEGGIADALKLAEHFAEDEKFVVILGDNILEKSIASHVEAFRTAGAGGAHPAEGSARSRRDSACRVSTGSKKIVNIAEKPRGPGEQLRGHGRLHV
jgi:glucose-1-phosphate thymidylyltransferase